MTREEFLKKQGDSERRIKRRVIPLGIVYTVRLMSPFVIVFLALLLPGIWQLGDARIRVEFVMAIVCFILFFVGSFPLERDTKTQFQRLALRCPECSSYLVFIRYDTEGSKALESGCCYYCGKRVFDL